MKSHTHKIKKLLLLVLILGLLSLNSLILYHEDAPKISKNLDRNNNNDGALNLQDLSSDNTYSGIGQAWNITHWANRTDRDLIVNFDEGSTDQTGVPLYSGWQATKIQSKIYDLYDTRNWNNGSFQYGDSDLIARNDDDSVDIVNKFQNWTFSETDTGNPNDMSGNYVNSSATIAVGQDCLELRMDGSYYNDPELGDRYIYEKNDRGWWETDFDIPRGKLIDSVLKFQLNPIHLISFNSWEFTVRINNIQVYSIGILTLKEMGVNTWHNFNIPQGIWTNTSNVFISGNLNDTSINMEVSIHYTATSASYGQEDGENVEYQQILIDNVELVTTAEALPSDLQLKTNGVAVSDIDWGLGEVELNGNWAGDGSILEVIFSADDISKLGAYEVDLETKINQFAFQDLPESNYETNEASLGTEFTINNATEVNWLTYGKVKVPTRYEETLMRLEFPQDVTIQSVFDPQDPSQNVLNLCDNSTLGVLNIDVPLISATPDGFWRFIAKSPNYCDGISLFNNKTGPWTLSNEFIAGEYVNITANINNSPLVSSYIQNTRAMMQIRFPNGSLWTEKQQLVQVGSNGIVKFDVFQVPSTDPFYQEGSFQAIVSWNNSFGIHQLNESGLIIKTFKVVHNSILEPEKSYYEDNFENSLLNLKVSYSDLVNDKPIESALIYTYRYDNPTTIQAFSEISPGFYFLEFNLTGASYGNNSLDIYANSTYFENKVIQITIEIINQTDLILSEDFLADVQFNQNFTIQIDYLDSGTGLGISGADMSTDWGGEFSFLEVSPGRYNLTCNSSAPGNVAGNLYSFNIFADAYKYEFQTANVRVFITELESTISMDINGTSVGANEVFIVEVSEEVNITVQYRDILGNHLTGASVSVNGSEISEFLVENQLAEHYSIVLNADIFGQGIDNFVIYATKDNYKPNSIPFIFEIIERQTHYEIFLNGINRTLDPTLDLFTGEFLNITVKYTDIGDNHISGAIISLSGDYSNSLIENEEQYSLIIDTGDLDVGIRLVTISASKSNYEFQSVDLRLQIKRISVGIQLVSGPPILTVKPDSSTQLQIQLYNLLSNDTVIGANVTFDWIFGEGQLTDDNNDGIYEASIGGVQEGTYTIIITASLSDDYDFESLEITLVVVSSQDELILFQIGLTASIISVALVAIYLGLYLTILKYPKPIRRVRKYSKTLKRSRNPPVNIIEREKAFRSNYEGTTGKSSKFLKGKVSSPKQRIDKLQEKTSKATIKELSGDKQPNEKTGGGKA